jgi:MFS family permease
MVSVSVARMQIRGSAVGVGERGAWLRAGAALFGAAWGSNQFTPMLLVYRRQLGLSTGTLEALFGVYALGLIPGLLIAGPLSDARGRRPVILTSAALSLAAVRRPVSHRPGQRGGVRRRDGVAA